MKKNRMMRLASILLVAVLMTTSVISGTYAKYVTTGSGNDSARVAKWGIALAVTGGDTVFSEEYEGTGNTAGKITVKSENGDVVAPGTANSKGVTFTLSGKPEVAFKLTASLVKENAPVEDIFLQAGTYSDYTTAAETTDTFELDAIYYPVKFTLEHTYEDGGYSIMPGDVTAGTSNKIGEYTASALYSVQNDNKKVTITGTLKDIDAVLGQVSTNMAHVNPNYVLKDTFTLTWEWVFGDAANNKADTLLGNLAAGTASLDSEKYNLELNYNFAITVEQID